MNTTAAYRAITTACSILEMPKAYMSDVFRHDNRTTAENPDLPFVWTVRECGTNLFTAKASRWYWRPFFEGLEASGERIFIWDGSRLYASGPLEAAIFLEENGRTTATGGQAA